MILLSGQDRGGRKVILTLSENANRLHFDIYIAGDNSIPLDIRQRLASFELTEAHRAELKKWL